MKAGADCAIGFKESVVCGAASDWVREFLKLYENQYATGRPVDFEDIALQAYRTVISFDKYNDETINLDSFYVVYCY